MFNEAQVSVVGFVATDPEYKLTPKGVPLLAMRVAWTTRRKDAETGEWYDVNSSFANVSCWRQLALNLKNSVRKGDPVMLRGSLNIRQYTGKDGQRGTSVDIDADTVGHNLGRGVAVFQKVLPSAGKTAAELEAEQALAGTGADGMPGMADGAAAAGAGPEMFDDSVIEALAKETDTAATF
jgi:single stranded DNA-binding protein